MRPPDCPPTSVRLLRRLHDLGDNDAWQRFFLRYQPFIEAWCARRLRRAEAEEVASAVLVKLVEKMPVFVYDPARGQFRAWLRTTVEHAIADSRRRARLPRATLNDPDGLLRDWPDPASLDALTSDLDERFRTDLDIAEQLVARVRQRVTARTWEVFWEAIVEGHPKAEVARRHDLSVYAAYQACQRVLRYLQEEWRLTFPQPEGR